MSFQEWCISQKDKVKQQFKQIMGYNLDLENPKTISEKLNWLKVYDSTFLKTLCSDKLKVREYVKDKIGKDLFLPVHGVYDNEYIEFLINNIKDNDVFCAYNADIIGGLMIYKSSIFDKDFWEKLTDEIIETKVDDTYIYYYLNHKKIKFVKNVDRKKRWKTFNESFPTRDYYLNENRTQKCDTLCRELFK